MKTRGQTEKKMAAIISTENDRQMNSSGGGGRGAPAVYFITARIK